MGKRTRSGKLKGKYLPPKPPERFVLGSGSIVYLDENKDYHREDGPAVINANGSEYWYIHGCHMRLDGPSVITSRGSEHWEYKGKRFRFDGGPASIYADGTEEFFNKNGCLRLRRTPRKDYYFEWGILTSIVEKMA